MNALPRRKCRSREQWWLRSLPRAKLPFSHTYLASALLYIDAVYHFTDLPSFVSGEHLVMFDPHTKYVPGATHVQPGIKVKKGPPYPVGSVVL